MGRVNGSIPSLVNGVSQQPDSLRLPTQAEAQVNAISSLSDGLAKRPPLQHVAKLMPSSNVNSFIHFINRDVNERYVVVIGQSQIAVFGKNGEQYPVFSASNNDNYLVTGAPNTSLRALTVSDVTFILNRTVTTALTTNTVPARQYEALVWFRGSGYSTDYTIKVFGTAVTYTTSATDPNTLKTTAIADYFATNLASALGTGWTITRFNNALWIKQNNLEPFKITVGDSAGDQFMSLVTDSVPSFSALPDIAPNGFITRVKGDIESVADDYWVRFDTNSDLTFGPGLWKETAAPGSHYQFDSATMPHQLVRHQDVDGTATGTVGQIYFRYIPVIWSERTSSDDDTSPPPSFIGRTLSDIFIHRSRLGLLSQSNVVMSQTGVFENFWKQTALTLLDDDPIDVYLAHSSAVNLRHASNFNNNLLLFSEHTQFILKGGDVLSPKTVSTSVSTEYSSHIAANPVNAENLIYFPFDDGAYSGVREYYVDGQNNQNDAKTVTAHCPRFIVGSVLQLSVSPVQDIMFLHTEADRNRLYAYKWFWNGNEKVQSSWSYWEFGQKTTILGHGYLGDVMYLVLAEVGGTFLCRINLDPGAVDSLSSFPTMLDRKVNETADGVFTYYDAQANTTYIRPPYLMDQDDDWIVTTRANGDPTYSPARVMTKVAQDQYSITVRGDARKGFWLGRRYTMRYTFSHTYLRSQSPLSGVDTISEGRLQLLDFAVKYNRTGYFRIEVAPDHRETVAYPMTGQVLKSPALLTLGLGDVQIRDGVLRVPVLCRNTEVTISAVNDSHLPSYLSSAEWVAHYTQKSRRV